jgi:hypothetical protein
LAKRRHTSKYRALRFERRHDQLAPVPVFVKRLIASLAIALALIAFALTIGISGYHTLGKLGWVDSLLEASMILGGMGPVSTLSTDGVKIFASLYALFSGLVFVGVMGIVLAPVVHRFLHKFHVDEEGGE